MKEAIVSGALSGIITGFFVYFCVRFNFLGLWKNIVPKFNLEWIFGVFVLFFLADEFVNYFSKSRQVGVDYHTGIFLHDAASSIVTLLVPVVLINLRKYLRDKDSNPG